MAGGNIPSASQSQPSGSASAGIVLQLLIAVTLLHLAQAEYCTGYGHICNYPNKCCANKCCIPSEDYDHAYRVYRWNIWNMWYFWFIVIFFMMSCFGGCGYWRRRQILLAQHHSRSHPGLQAYTTTTTTTTYHCGGRPGRVAPSHGVPLYPRVGMAFPNQITNCNAETQGLFPAPPPYAEVMTKPNMYPPTTYDTDGLPPYPGDPVYLPTDVPADVQPGENRTSDALAASGGLPPYSALLQPPCQAAATAATSAAGGPTAGSATNQLWRPAYVALPPEEMDSNGNEINSNISLDNANLQPANQQPGNSNPANQRRDGDDDSNEQTNT